MAVLYHRKIWELCYVLQALDERGVLTPGTRGLGFGCGQEPIPSLLAAMGINVTVTDLESESARRQGWVGTAQHASGLRSCHRANLVDWDTFSRHASFEHVDMNQIPAHLRDYDFCWSVCSLEHLGTIANGLSFIEKSLETLKPGGFAIHTTEFNFMNDEQTIDSWPTVLFQRRHFEDVARRLRHFGHVVAELDFNIGSGPMDKFIDLPPYVHDFHPGVAKHWAPGVSHLKLLIDGFPSTCFGLIIQKKPGSAGRPEV
jgi:2-polyprenyl-3-methyl-5-hydroxy-6-metoxy-1,4-benzoquinol methylase